MRSMLLLFAVINLSLLFLISSLYGCMYAYPQCWRILSLIFFLTHIVRLCQLSGGRPCALSSTYCLLIHLYEFFLFYLKNGPEYLIRGTALVFILFDEIPVTNLGFKMFSRSSEEFFSHFSSS